MANLTATAQSIKKIAPFLFFWLIIIFLVGVIIYRFTRKPERPAPIPIPPPLINQNPSQKQPAGFDFSTFQIPEIPKELPIFNAKPYSMTDSTAKAFASNMGFTEEPFLVEENTTDGTQYDWQKGQETLILSQSRLIYQNNSLETDQDLSLDTLKQITFSFIQKA